MPACSMSATPKPARPMVRPSFCCTAGPMTSTPLSTVAPILASSGFRVIVPYLRGYGTTRFLSTETLRNGQPGALATDIIDLLDALKIDKCVIAGFDWGARTAAILAALWPERCKALVSVSGYRQPGSQQDAVAAQGRTGVVVSVLFRHRTRPRWLREIPSRIFQTDLAAGIAEMEF